MNFCGRLLLLSALQLAFSMSAPAEAPDETSAKAFVETLRKGDFDDAFKRLDATMAAKLDPAALRRLWNSIEAKAGKFKALEEVKMTREVGGYRVFVTRALFEKTALDITTSFDAEGRVAGLFFRPAATPVDFKLFSELPFKVVCADGAELPGTLAMPKGEGPFPALLLVHGSGPQDRDENIGPNAPFRDLARGLASKGIAVLRYDKRTRVLPRPVPTAKEECVDDALAALAALRQVHGVDPKRVFALGHSLGGYLMPRIAKGDSETAAFILLAAPARPLEDLILEQMPRALRDDPEKNAKLADLRKETALVKSKNLSAKTPSNKLPLGIPASYWLDLRNYKPVEDAAKTPRPFLILQGDKDCQVSLVDFELWRKGLKKRTDVEFKLCHGLNHLFIPGEGEPSDYAKAGNVAQEAIDAIASWMGKSAPGK